MKHFCRQASRLESDAFERRLTLTEQLRLRLHLLLCSACRCYRRELQLMRTIFRRIQDQPGDLGHGMSDNERAHILNTLHRIAGE